MRQSLLSLLFAAALFFDYSTLSVASPTQDGSLEQEAFPSLLSDEATEGGLRETDLTSATKARGPRLIVVAADPSVWRDLRVLQNGLSVYKRRADDNQGAEHRDVGQQLSLPILRRDTMRCMVGRVYRPCWEV